MSGGGDVGQGILANKLGAIALLVMFAVIGGPKVFEDNITSGLGFFGAIAMLGAVGFLFGAGGAAILRGAGWLVGRVCGYDRSGRRYRSLCSGCRSCSRSCGRCRTHGIDQPSSRHPGGEQ